MKIYHLPPSVRALAFDMDLTLYSHAEYGKFQTDCMIEKLGKIRGASFDDMKNEVEGRRSAWELSKGRKPSLANILTTFGLSIEEIVRWREELIEPGQYLKKDRRLGKTLEKLSASFVLGVVTNNPVLVAQKTFAALGVSGVFSVIVGIDTCMVSKPHRIPFEKFSELSFCPPETCVSIGDRYDIDLAIPLELGMGGILIDGAEDVYKMPDILDGVDSNQIHRAC